MTLKNSKKLFVIDTSVLLYDKECIKNLSSNDIIIPLIVLEEIDKFKTREGILGENARYINRFLDSLRDKGSLHSGIYLSDFNINIRVETKCCWDNIESLDKSDNDSIIIATAIYANNNLSSDYSKVVLITKDINLRVKCDSIGIFADDYYADYKFIEREKVFSDASSIEVSAGTVDRLYRDKHLTIHSLQKENNVMYDFYENECVIVKSSFEGSSSGLCIKKGNNLTLAKSKQEIYKFSNIEAKNKEQVFALNLLLDDSIPLVTLTGMPGSGKTYLTLMTAINLIEKQKKNRIIFTRPIQTVGKDIGFLPGTLNEKMAPWLAPIVDNFRNQFGDLSYFDIMIEKGTIDVAPLSYIRGRSFNDAVIIVDEAQNATVHELKTVITRTGNNSKVVLLGDIEQVDLPYVDKFSNGLTIVSEKLKPVSLTGHVHFEKGYRSELANEAAKLL